MGNLFHFLSIMHTWTDAATFGAIEQHVLWIFLHIHREIPRIYNVRSYPRKLTEKSKAIYM